MVERNAKARNHSLFSCMNGSKPKAHSRTDYDFGPTMEQEMAALAGGQICLRSTSRDDQRLPLVFPMGLSAMNFGVCIGNRLVVRRAELGLVGRSGRNPELVGFHRLVKRRARLRGRVGEYAVYFLGRKGCGHLVSLHLSRRG